MRDDIVYKAVIGLSKEEIAGMYAVCNERSIELQDQLDTIKQAYKGGAVYTFDELVDSQDFNHDEQFITLKAHELLISRVAERLHAANQIISKKLAEINELRNGTKGACFTCEPVGELNQALQKELAELKAHK